MFLVIEIQTMAEDQVAYLVSTHKDGNLAESKYHTVLAAAAVSALPKHAAVILDEEGNLYTRQCYRHGEDTGESEETTM